MTPATFDQRGSDITTAVPHCRATYERSVADNIDAILENPAVARANQAASTDMPQGSVGYSQRFSDYVSHRNPLHSIYSPSFWISRESLAQALFLWFSSYLTLTSGRLDRPPAARLVFRPRRRRRDLPLGYLYRFPRAGV